MSVSKIVAGGQTGVDMAALDFARAHKISYGGWIPKGRTNESGGIPAEYSGLVETQSTSVNERTRLNVQSSSATLVFVDGSISPGTQQTIVFASEAGKPCLVIDVRHGLDACVRQLRDWLRGRPIEVLNVAGPRASEAPGLGAQVRDVLKGCLAEFTQPK
ncbi:putative molybdenum carrier protein [uncultured Ruegeria sp.]|uniref:putative molybdenum carrier protein n=1 Tax=uncultured Ruegeria sp. TaxID=259304 RepID=UPI00345BD50A